MNVIDTIKSAMRNTHLLRIKYEKKTTQEAKEYVVEPYSFRDERFFGRRIDIPAPKGIRGFYISNILTATEINKTFVPIWDVEKTEYGGD